MAEPQTTIYPGLNHSRIESGLEGAGIGPFQRRRQKCVSRSSSSW